MRYQAGSGRAAQHVQHPAEGDPGLRVVRQEGAKEMGEVGHEGQVVQEDGEIAHAQLQRAHRLRHQQQDETGTQAHDIAEGRVQQLLEYPVFEHGRPSFFIKDVEARGDALLRSRDLNGLYGTEDFAQETGNGPGGLAAGAAILLQALSHGLHQRDDGYQWQKDAERNDHADPEQDHQRNQGEQAQAHQIDGPVNGMVYLLDIFAKAGDGLASRAGYGLRARQL